MYIYSCIAVHFIKKRLVNDTHLKALLLPFHPKKLNFSLIKSVDVIKI